MNCTEIRIECMRLFCALSSSFSFFFIALCAHNALGVDRCDGWIFFNSFMRSIWFNGQAMNLIKANATFNSYHRNHGTRTGFEALDCCQRLRTSIKMKIYQFYRKRIPILHSLRKAIDPFPQTLVYKPWYVRRKTLMWCVASGAIVITIHNDEHEWRRERGQEPHVDWIEKI